ncbi:DMT family transporter [Actinocrispum wychmicini]|uniref:Drug/metabolite transporter (DMT)-like permease n=1 Tax=Actinocrispum wychmicini TaxID=1213861 RepID=A0A4R2JIZ0_9PSEU|nr:DMT family transporter [Actinocrispum wychmicini]TCO54105.1 drug/metabolite transporter (DMT)-like permease [Actinocrispum wychmicini]
MIRPMWHISLGYCALVWGATFYIVKAAIADVDPVTMVAYRFLLAALLLLPVVLLPRIRSSLWDARAFRSGAILGAFLGTSYLTQTLGLKYTSAANSGFITGLFVIFVPLFLMIFLRRPLAAAQWAACGVAVAGLWLLTSGGVGVNIGDALTVLTAMAYAAQVLAADRFARTDGASPLVLAFHQFWIIGVGSLALSLLLGRPLDVGTNQALWAILLLTLLPTLSAFVIQIFAQRHVSAMTTTMIFMLEPVFAALFAWTAGGERFSALPAAGGALIVAAMVWTERARPKANPPSEVDIAAEALAEER